MTYKNVEFYFFKLRQIEVCREFDDASFEKKSTFCRAPRQRYMQNKNVAKLLVHPVLWYIDVFVERDIPKRREKNIIPSKNIYTLFLFPIYHDIRYFLWDECVGKKRGENQKAITNASHSIRIDKIEHDAQIPKQENISNHSCKRFG